MSTRQTMKISDFKAHALQVIGRIAESHENMVITKRGKAVVEIIPYHPPVKEAKPGKLASALVQEKDIVTPFGDSLWEISK